MAVAMASDRQPRTRGQGRVDGAGKIVVNGENNDLDFEKSTDGAVREHR